jgi:acetyltransferase-like isoleucine patch superfamily enzyme/dTDP-4-dehydrorhamnose 3,5-epimerase-like enzyme
MEDLVSGPVFVHERALVEPGATIGMGTRVWAFAHVLGGAVIGRDCNLCDMTFIENDVVIGDRVTIKCGVQIWDGVRLDDDVFVGPNATFTNDLFPRSKKYPEKYAVTQIREGASIGANATILAGVVVGQFAMVGAGAVVTKSVPPYAVVVGNPATIRGYVREAETARPAGGHAAELPGKNALAVPSVGVIELPCVKDLRGELTFGELGQHLPFAPKRFFSVYNVPSRDIRGEHAHRKCHQVVMCAKGSVSIMVDDGRHRDTVKLDRPNVALHIPPMVWASQYQYSSDAILLVLASDTYDASDYIRVYEEFLREVGPAAPGSH